tara:strand:+ start:5325 stop:6266 length:942 start_codon:yes stop_codon:yes gene_type:complete
MKIAVLMCTKNGSRFIVDQLESIKNQEFKNFDIYISDNGSTDNTISYVKKFASTYDAINIFYIEGKDMHFANNFIFLAKNIEQKYDFYAFCDQDDVWSPNHISRGINELSCFDKDLPLLHCSRTTLIDESGIKIGKSKKFLRKPSFQNALVQSIAGGNTMIFNSSAYEILIKASIKSKIVSHDWLLYILVSGCNGKVVYDQESTVFYRQHDKNLIGSNNGFLNKLKRALMLVKGTFGTYNRLNSYQIDFIECLTPKNLEIYNLYKNSFQGSILERLKSLIISGVYRQSKLGQIGLVVHALLNKREKEAINEKL